MSPVAATALRRAAAASSIADAFMATCRPLYTTASCAPLATSILAGGTNTAARAGMLCSLLGRCPQAAASNASSSAAAAACSTLSTPSLRQGGGSSLLTGALDLCSAEGVAGGTATPLPGSLSASEAASRGLCRRDSDCGRSGATCQLASQLLQACSCAGGVDVCQEVGSCQRYCASEAAAGELQRLNAGINTCSLSGGGRSAAGQCPSGQLCAAAPACSRWVCDEASQTLTQQPCQALCTALELRPLGAKLAADGRSVAVALSAPAAPLSRVACEAVFDGAMAAALGGSAALCSTTADGGLTVGLPAASTLQAGQFIVLRSSGGSLVSQQDAARAFNGSVKVEPCDLCAAPRAAISGPRLISQPCDSGGGGLLQVGSSPPAFDASLSSDPSGRAFADVRWSVVAWGGGEASLLLLRAAVNRTNALPSARERLRLSLMSAEAAALEDFSGYTLQVSLLSWLGTSAAASISFAKESTATAPAIGIVGRASTFQIGGGIRLAAEVAGGVCQGKSLEWRWTALGGWAGLPAAGLAGQQLYLPGPLPAAHGQNVTLRVTARYVGYGAGEAASVDVILTAVGAAPVAALKGPSGDAPAEAPVVLDAGGSRDPDATAQLQRLRYSWSCRLEESLGPCFAGAAQGDKFTTPGVWNITPGLLTAGKWHVVTVTVSKDVAGGASSLQSTATIRFRPRSSAVSFPRGALTRQCRASGCSGPQPTSRPLTLRLVLAPGFEDSAVAWSSPEAPAVGSLTSLANTAADPDIPRGSAILSIPAAALPVGRPSLTIIANLTASTGATGQASITVPLNSAPDCSLAANATDRAACLTLEVLSDTFPQAAVRLVASGWVDPDEPDAPLRFEFGTRDTSAAASGDGYSVQQLGAAPSATIVGLVEGPVMLYGCAIDSQGSRTCAEVGFTVLPPAAGFDAVAALGSVDMGSLSEARDQRTLLAAASQVALLAAVVSGAEGGASDAATEMVAAQSTALVGAIMGGAAMEDEEQARQAIAAVAAIASSTGSILPESAKAVMLDAARAAVLSLGSDAAGASSAEPAVIDEGFATNICSLLGAALPAAARGRGSSSARRRALAAATTTFAPTSTDSYQQRSRRVAQSDNTTPSTPSTQDDTSSTGNAQGGAAAGARLLQLVALSGRLGAALGRQAVPGAEPVAVGGGGVYVGAAAMSVAGGAQVAAVSVQVSAGLGGGSGAVPSSGAVSKPSAGAAGAASRLAQRAYRVHGRRRLLAGTSGTAAAAGDDGAASGGSGRADVRVVLSGDAAAAAANSSIGLTYAPSAAAGLATALAGRLPAGVAVAGGLTTVTWDQAAGSAAALPALGADSYITLRLPAPGYSAAKAADCLAYDAAAGAVTGGSWGLQGATPQPPALMSYDAATSTVMCRVAAFGSYLVAYGPAPPPPPLPASSPQQQAAQLPPPSLPPLGSLSPPPPPAPPPPPPEPVTEVLNLVFTMNATALSAPGRQEAFKGDVAAALAAHFQVAHSAVRITSVQLPSNATRRLLAGPASPYTAVLVTAEATLPHERAEALTAAFSRDPLAAFPAAFTSRYGVVSLEMKSDNAQSGGSGGGTQAGGAGGRKGPPAGAVAGGVAGGVVAAVLLAAAAALLVLVRRRRRGLNAVSPTPSVSGRLTASAPDATGMSAGGGGGGGSGPLLVSALRVAPYALPDPPEPRATPPSAPGSAAGSAPGTRAGSATAAATLWGPAAAGGLDPGPRPYGPWVSLRTPAAGAPGPVPLAAD